MLNIANTSLTALEASFGVAFNFCYELYRDKNRRKVSFISRKEIVNKLHIFLISILRGIRAFNFTSLVVEYLKKCFKFLIDNDYESDFMISAIKDAFNKTYEKLIYKGQNDESLKNDEIF